MTPKFVRPLVASISFVFVFSLASYTQTGPGKNFPGISIKNFGQMDERYFRGAQPKPGQYESLKNLGISTVIDLTDKPKDYEKTQVEALGMKYVHIPMSSKKYPASESIATFLSVVDDPETGKFFVHCAGGRHRTGVTGAVYRFEKDGWDFDQVYREMRNYDYYTSWGSKMKVFVKDYANKTAAERTAPAAMGGTADTGAQRQ
jgi:protein tyrosine/serine phosphatase